MAHQGKSEIEMVQPNARNRYEISEADLPLACPMPAMSLWNSHPRVFLPLEKTGEAKCPYCGASYILTGKDAA
jgi:uncharacterized Zn-finger protein